MLIFFSACDQKDEPGKIVIAGKEFTEQFILAHIMGEYLQENTDMDVEVKDGLGGVFVLHEAMKKGEIDMYIEYTGTALENVIEQEFDPEMSPEEIYKLTKEMYEDEFNMTWLEPLGFNNTYTLAMRSELYNELDIETYSELKKYTPDLIFGADSEFFERDDGYDGLLAAYEFEDFADKVSIEPDLMYEAAEKGEVDIIDAFATDARIDQFNLEVLDDDKGFFPPYDAAIVIRNEILELNPELEDVLNELGGLLDDDRMRELNGRVNLEGKKAKEVAIEFLKEEGLID